MKCPICKDSSSLVITERKGIEIDYCPNCRGVWLDRGELDKILERSREEEKASAAKTVSMPPHPESDRERFEYERKKDYKYGYKRRKSFLEELFD